MPLIRRTIFAYLFLKYNEFSHHKYYSTIFTFALNNTTTHFSCKIFCASFVLLFGKNYSPKTDCSVTVAYRYRTLSTFVILFSLCVKYWNRFVHRFVFLGMNEFKELVIHLRLAILLSVFMRF